MATAKAMDLPKPFRPVAIVPEWISLALSPKP